MSDAKKEQHLIGEMAKGLAVAGDLISRNTPPPHDLYEALCEVALCFLLMSYCLVNKYGLRVALPRFFSSERFARVWPRMQERLDECVPDQPLC